MAFRVNGVGSLNRLVLSSAKVSSRVVATTPRLVIVISLSLLPRALDTGHSAVSECLNTDYRMPFTRVSARFHVRLQLSHDFPYNHRKGIFPSKFLSLNRSRQLPSLDNHRISRFEKGRRLRRPMKEEVEVRVRRWTMRIIMIRLLTITIERGFFLQNISLGLIARINFLPSIIIEFRDSKGDDDDDESCARLGSSRFALALPSTGKTVIDADRERSVNRKLGVEAINTRWC